MQTACVLSEKKWCINQWKRWKPFYDALAPTTPPFHCSNQWAQCYRRWLKVSSVLWCRHTHTHTPSYLFPHVISMQTVLVWVAKAVTAASSVSCVMKNVWQLCFPDFRHLSAQPAGLSMSTVWQLTLPRWTLFTSAAHTTLKAPAQSSEWVMVHLSALRWLNVTWGRRWHHLKCRLLLYFKKMKCDLGIKHHNHTA